MSPYSFTLYHYWRSSSSWRLRLAFVEKDIPIHGTHIDLLKTEHRSAPFLKRNPAGTVPVLEVRETSAEFSQGRTRYMTETMAILEFLEQAKVGQSSLIPTDPWQAFEARRIAETINSGIQPLQNLKVLRAYADDPEKQKTWARKWIQEGLENLEKFLSESAQEYCVGNNFSIADIFLVPQLYNAERFECDLTGSPNIHRVYENCKKRPSYFETHPDRFKPEV